MKRAAIICILQLFIGTLYAQLQQAAQWDFQGIITNAAYNSSGNDEVLKASAYYGNKFIPLSNGGTQYTASTFTFERNSQRKFDWNLIFQQKNYTLNQKQMKFLVGFQYDLYKGDHKKKKFIFGAQLGILQRTSDGRELTFANQYDPSSSSGFNALMPTGEQSDLNLKSIKGNGNLGLFYSNKKKKWDYWFGASINNLEKKFVVSANTVSFRELYGNFAIGLTHQLDTTIQIKVNTAFLIGTTARLIQTNLYLNYFQNKYCSTAFGISLASNNSYGGIINVQLKNTDFRFAYLKTYLRKTNWQESRFEVGLSHRLTWDNKWLKQVKK